MKSVVSNIKLHLNLRKYTYLVPLSIMATVAAISVLISLIFLRAGSVPGSQIWVDSSQSNPGIIYAFAGFLVYRGVASVATTFPFALMLGATRRTFVAGTLVWYAFSAAYIAAALAILAALEIATGHWFSGFYIFDITVLGAGETGRLLAIVFLGVLTALTVGGAFGAAWVRFGTRGPQVIASGIVAVIAVIAIIVVPDAVAIFTNFHLWWLAVAAGVVIALAGTGSWLLLRSAIVR